MAAAILEARIDSVMTTDGTRYGCDAIELRQLTSELTTALNGAFVSYLLQAELEDAFDTALLRAALAETPAYTDAVLFTTA